MFYSVFHWPKEFSNPDLFFFFYFHNRSTVVPLSHLF